jgi:ubiquinone/menaquinone biosynthesis C-methylase UbiE
LQTLFERAGYLNVRFVRWTGGIVTLHSARKP